MPDLLHESCASLACTAGVFLEAGFAPAALAYLADVSQTFARDRGLLMGLYSVILGIGQFLGNGLGAIFAQAWSFDGLAYLTVLLAAVAIGAVALLLCRQGRIANCVTLLSKLRST